MNRSEIVSVKHKGKIALVLAVLLLFGFLCMPVARAAEKVPRAVLRSADSVVRVVATSSREISSGTGFVIKNSREGLLMRQLFAAKNGGFIYEGLCYGGY